MPRDGEYAFSGGRSTGTGKASALPSTSSEQERGRTNHLHRPDGGFMRHFSGPATILNP